MFKVLILQQWYGLSDLEVERQLDAMGLQVKRGTIQDATFIEADPGSSKKLRGGDAKTRLSRDGTWTKKGIKSYFGDKLHQKTDMPKSSRLAVAVEEWPKTSGNSMKLSFKSTEKA